MDIKEISIEAFEAAAIIADKIRFARERLHETPLLQGKLAWKREISRLIILHRNMLEIDGNN